MRMILLSIGGQLLLNFILLWIIWTATDKGSKWRKAVLAIIGCEVVAFVVIASYKVIVPDRGDFLRIGGSLFVDYYVFISLLLMPLLVAYFVIWLLRHTNLLKERVKRKSARRWAIIILTPLAMAACIQGYYSSQHPVITRYEVSVPHNGEAKELKIALITDMHIGELIGRKDLEKMVRLVQAERPDYVFIGGDQLDYYFDYVEKDPEITKLITSLHPDSNRIYHVLGNHEYYIDLEQKCQWIKDTGILLRDSVVQLSDSLYLIGRDDAYNEFRSPLSKLTDLVPDGATTIVLDHQPIEPDIERDLGIDLSLHGHTHDGQFIPFKWLVALRFENSYGYLKKGNTHYITSSGFGYSSSPILFGTKSEVVMIHLKLE